MAECDGFASTAREMSPLMAGKNGFATARSMFSLQNRLPMPFDDAHTGFGFAKASCAAIRAAFSRSRRAKAEQAAIEQHFFASRTTP